MRIKTPITKITLVENKKFRSLEPLNKILKGAKITNIEPIKLLIKNLG